MTWFADDSPCTYFGDEAAAVLRAVGWLSPEHDYTTGDVSQEFFSKLTRLTASPPCILVFKGFHPCELCRFTHAMVEQSFEGLDVKGVSHLNVFVPATEFLYVAPESVPHYIDAHGYRPPDTFVEAVLACPEPGTSGFEAAFLEAGGERLLAVTGESL